MENVGDKEQQLESGQLWLLFREAGIYSTFTSTILGSGSHGVRQGALKCTQFPKEQAAVSSRTSDTVLGVGTGEL